MVKKEVYLKVFVITLAFVFISVSVDAFTFREKTCGDGTTFGSCSLNDPYFCEAGSLVSKASVCGCPDVLEQNGDFCVSKYQKDRKEITLNYILDGKKDFFKIFVYDGMVEYLTNLPLSIRYTGNETPSRADFKIRNVNEEEQRELLLPLVIRIQNLEDNKLDQARIAISLVQNIQYGFTKKKIQLVGGGTEINYSRYPYEVLYDNTGICGEKTELLAFLLKEIGYEVGFFFNGPENHESVGIKCPKMYDYGGTGYCFLETTGPAIITDDSIVYTGGITLESKPEFSLISEGESFPFYMKEYTDANIMKRVRKGFLFFKKNSLNRLKDRYGLVEEYNLA